jgi:aldehyde dehydrogenase (NAD+)
MRIAREEIFGPVLAVIKAKNLDEAIAIANDADFGLSAGISTSNLATSLDFARRIEAGVVHVNNPTAGLELQLPFGGCKCSSSGYREMGKAAIDFYSLVKTVYVDG